MTLWQTCLKADYTLDVEPLQFISSQKPKHSLFCWCAGHDCHVTSSLRDENQKIKEITRKKTNLKSKEKLLRNFLKNLPLGIDD